MKQKTMKDRMVDGVVIPAAQAGIGGALFGITSTIGFWVGSLLGKKEGIWEIPFPMGLLTWGSSTTLLYFWFRSEWANGTYVERQPVGNGLSNAFASDTASPIRRPRTELHLNVYENNSGLRMVLPGDSEKLIKFAKGLKAGIPCSGRSWYGSNGIYTENEYVNLRNELILRGLARWKSEKSYKLGWELTGKGNAIFDHLANLEIDTPLLKKYFVQSSNI